MTFGRLLTGAILCLFSSFMGLSQGAGNGENWCREGFFTTASGDIRIGVVPGAKGEKTFFYNDLQERCPGHESCKGKAYLIPNDKVVVSRELNNFACAWYAPLKGPPTVGWIKLDKLTFLKGHPTPSLNAWLGEWRYGDNRITFSLNKLKGYLNVSGAALWKGLGDNVHIGELDDKAKPAGGILKYGEGDKDEYACQATLRLLDAFLIVADNLNCGGVNVTFTGIYRKVK